MKKLTALAALTLLLLTQRPLAQAAGLRIFFVDIGQGAGTLVVGPPDATGKSISLLVDGGPPGGGTTKIVPLLDTLGIAKIDYTVVTHYHIDHISGVTELLQAGRVGTIAYDNGDDGALTPPPGGTRDAYTAYVNAANVAGVSRQQIQPGDVITLGAGARATTIVAGGRLLSRGVVPITNRDLNSESIALLVEFGSFDFLVSGDLTGGGSTSTAKTPDVETYVGQLVGDLDVVQLNHHGSTTTSNQTFLAAVKAEVAVAQASDDNTFGHPHRETVNKYLNTPVTNLNTHPLPGVPTPGSGPVFYQPEAPVSGDDRVTLQGISAAGPGGKGNGTILLQTDGTTAYSLTSVDDGGVRINPAVHTYPIDGVSPGVTTNFPPTVQVDANPVLPLASEPVTITAAIFDRELFTISSAVLAYSVNGVAQPSTAMTLNGTVYQATIPAQPDGTRVSYTVAGTAVQPVIGAQTTTWSSGYFSGVTPVASLRALTAKGEPLYTGYTARIQGTVTASGFSGGSTNDDYVQDDAGGAINVYRSSDTPTVFTATSPGQRVEARGRVNFNGGRLRLDLTESVEKTTSPFGVAILSPGPAPSPVTTTIAALTANPESFEGQFFSIANASITSGTIPSTPQALDRFVTISDGTGSLSMKIDDDTDIEGFTPAATFTAIGILQQDDYLRPFDSGYNLTPRSRVDLGAAGPGEAPLLTIAEARVDVVTNATSTSPADFVPDRLGEIVKVRGAVTSIDLRGGNGIEYYIQDSTGGIDLFSTTLNAGPFVFGDNVEAIGAVTHFNGLTELTVTSVTLLSPGAPPAPAIVTAAELGDAGAGEAIEGRLVRLNNVTISNPPTVFPAGNLTVSDGAGRTATIRIDGDTEIDGTPVPCGPISVIGVVGQFDNVGPFDSGYQLFPRTLADVIVSSTPAPGCGGNGGGGADGIVISEFRTRGPSGGNDEFVEIYNNTDQPVDIAGWQLRGSSNTAPTGLRATVPPRVVLPGRAHYLFVNLAANGYSGATTGNVSYTIGIGDNGGIALTTDDGTTIVDQVGVTTTVTGYREGRPLATPLTSNTNRSYERLPGGTSETLQDTGDNLADFRLVSGAAPDLPNPQNIVLTPAPASVDFGTVTLPATAVRTVTAKNVLLASVTLNPISISGTDAADFSAGAPSATTLASGDSAAIDVTFTPGAAGTKNASLSITSSGSGSVEVALSGLAVCPAITVSGTVSPAEFGFAYSTAFSASGGTGPYTFNLSNGALPAGLGLDPSGVLSGTPTALGAFTFTVEAQTAIGCGGTASFTLTVVDTTPPALTLPGDLTAVATTPAGALVSFTATAFDLVNGSLAVACAPVSGTPFPIGATVVSCAAADAQGNRATGGFRVTVTEPAQPGRMAGDGRIETGSARHEFDFLVQEGATGGDAGALRYRVKSDRRGPNQDDRFEAVVTRVVFFNLGGVAPGRQPATGVDTVLISGAGRWNGAAGYSFDAQAIDAGEPGRGHDRFAITVRDAAGQIVASVDSLIENGNIESLRIAR